MTLNQALGYLKNAKISSDLGDDMKTACEIGAEALRVKIGMYETDIWKQLKDDITDSVAEICDGVRSKYDLIPEGQDISTSMECEDLIDNLADKLAKEMVNEMDGNY